MRKIKDKFIFYQSRHRVKHFEENEYVFLNQNFLRECIGKRYSGHGGRTWWSTLNFHHLLSPKKVNIL